MTQARLLWDCQCQLGEGVLWNAADQSVYFVDVKGCAILAYTPAGAVQRRWAMPHMTGWLVPRRSGGWMAGFGPGIAALQLHADGASHFAWLHQMHGPDSPLRLNDGKADAQGRLWFGSMNQRDEERPEGLLYRLEPGALPVEVDRGYAVANGPTFSPDGRTLYHTSSAQRTIYAFDVSASGELSNKRVWLRFEPQEGYPDGMTTDVEGNVWIAHWGGARVTQRTPDGRLLQTVPMPVPQVTNVAFGGPQLRDLYVTSARTGLDAAALAQAPMSGALFVVSDIAQGTVAHAFAG